ncbi:MAG: dihydroxyacetone kinase subunit DhaL [Inquilinaceae bacterium]
MEMTPGQFVDMLRRVAAAVDAEQDRLSALDGPIGDGDHGVTMAMGWAAVVEALDGMDPGQGFAALCNASAKAFLSAVGASAGPLYATALMRGGAAIKGRDNLDASSMAAFLGAACQGIRDRGKAEPDDKTMLDAWLPAVAAAEQAADAGAVLSACLGAAADGAEQGMERTRGLVARIGRASRLGDRSIGHIDPGAASSAVMFRAMADFAADPG